MFGNIPLMQMVQEICTAKSDDEFYQTFKLYEMPLKGWRFIRASKKGNMPGLSVNKTFPNGAAIVGLFSEDNLYFIDSETDLDMQNRKPFGIDYSVCLDTMAVSHLEAFIDRGKKPDRDFEEFFELVSSPNIRCDAFPYLQENVFRIRNDEHRMAIFKKLKAFNQIKYLDYSSFIKDKKVVSTISDDDLIKETQESLSVLMMQQENSNILAELKNLYQRYYLVLLKIVDIHFTSKKSASKKILDFFDFMHSEMCVITYKDALLAKAYFEKPSSLKFFGKIFKRQNLEETDVFKTLQGMAWDMKHIQEAVLNIGLTPDVGARYFIPSFFTFDRKFIDVLRLSAARACAIDPNGTVMPFFLSQKEIIELANETGDGDRFIQKFLSEEAVLYREKNRDKAHSNLRPKIDQLELRVAELLNITIDQKFDHDWVV